MEWTVSDTGIGIPVDRVGTLFGEFVQADNSISRRFGGTGLGLAISKRLVEQMGGSISVTSTPGEGSTFRVHLTLPIVAAPVEEIRQMPGQPAAWDAIRAALGRSPRLLFAEDNATNQFVARRMMRDLDIHLDMVANGSEAVEVASRIAYDVIFMDTQMPEMDGVTASRIIRPVAERRAGDGSDHRADRQCLAGGQTGLSRCRHEPVPDQAGDPRGDAERVAGCASA